MNILLIGSGGREHALAWKMAQSPLVDMVHSTPGNPGMDEEGPCFDVTVTDIQKLVQLTLQVEPDLIVIGPEAPLVDGLADNLRTMGVPVFGPNRKAAQLEGSKGFTKDLCKRANIPIVLTHHKVVGQPTWGASVKTLAMVDSARAAGTDAMIDQYPYTASYTGITILIPAWAMAGGTGDLLQRMEDPALAAIA